MTILAGFDSPIGVPTAHSLASGLARWFLAIRVSLDRASLRRVDIHLLDSGFGLDPGGFSIHSVMRLASQSWIAVSGDAVP